MGVRGRHSERIAWRAISTDVTLATYDVGDRTIAPRTYPAFIVAVIDEGALDAARGDRAAPAGPGWVIVQSPFTVTAARASTARVRARAVMLGGAHLRALERAAPSLVDRELVWAPELAGAVDRVFSAPNDGRAGHEAVHALAARLAARLSHRMRREGGRARPEVRRARDHLLGRLAETTTLDALSEAADLSKFHLLREFRAAIGATPRAFQTLARLAQARALLGGGVASSRVAADTGFADQSHFTRTFRTFEGMTPTAYVAAVREGGGAPPLPLK